MKALPLRRKTLLKDKHITVPLIPECSACIMNSLQILIPLLAERKEDQMTLFKFAYQKIAEGYEKKLEPLILSVDLYQRLYERAKIYDPYREIKERSIEAAETALPLIEESVESYEGYEKLRAALAASIAGNLIDFNTAYHTPDLDSLVEVYKSILEIGFALDDSNHLWRRLKSQKGHIVFLADNAGETLFDIPLLRLFRDLEWRTTFVVKEEAMINDATWSDVAGSEIESLCKIVDTGGWAHGVPRRWVSQGFLDLVASCDLVISKGQANVESFPEIQREIGVETYYVIRAKCPHIASSLGAIIGDNVVLRRPYVE
ncbi:MAG: ARMT1-like domain-containing protein [Candidatus Thorarchaeota archaeon]|nr:ARMT1-like domain-containing protein [Candidatus Thorarchaeota archaeon]